MKNFVFIFLMLLTCNISIEAQICPESPITRTLSTGGGANRFRWSLIDPAGNIVNGDNNNGNPTSIRISGNIWGVRVSGASTVTITGGANVRPGTYIIRKQRYLFSILLSTQDEPIPFFGLPNQTLTAVNVPNDCSGASLVAAPNVDGIFGIAYDWTDANGNILATGNPSTFIPGNPPQNVNIVTRATNICTGASNTNVVQGPPNPIPLVLSLASNSGTSLCQSSTQSFTITLTSNKCLKTPLGWSSGSFPYFKTGESQINANTYTATYTRISQPSSSPLTIPISVSVTDFQNGTGSAPPITINLLNCREATDTKVVVNEDKGTGSNADVATPPTEKPVVVATAATQARTANIYPNPVNSVLTVDNLAEVQSVRLVDVLGKTLEQMDVEPNQTQVRFNVARYAEGTYLIQTIATNGAINSSKVVIQH